LGIGDWGLGTGDWELKTYSQLPIPEVEILIFGLKIKGLKMEMKLNYDFYN